MADAPQNNLILFFKNDGTEIIAEENRREITNFPTIEKYNWSRDGYNFLYWNTQSDGSGDTYYAGDSFSVSIMSSSFYAIWEAVAPITEYYKVSSVDLKSVADAIRAKSGTSEALVYPDGFVSAIENIV